MRMRQEENVGGFVTGPDCGNGTDPRHRTPGIGFSSGSVNRNARFHERADAGLIVEFAFAGRNELRLRDNAVALGLLQQKRADDKRPRSGLKRQCGRLRRMMLSFRRNHVRRQHDAIELDGGAGRHG